MKDSVSVFSFVAHCVLGDGRYRHEGELSERYTGALCASFCNFFIRLKLFKNRKIFFKVLLLIFLTQGAFSFDPHAAPCGSHGSHFYHRGSEPAVTRQVSDGDAGPGESKAGHWQLHLSQEVMGARSPVGAWLRAETWVLRGEPPRAAGL